MKRKRQKKEAVFAAFFIILLVVQTGCAAKDETALPDGLFVQEDGIVTVDAECDSTEMENKMSQTQAGKQKSAEEEKKEAGAESESSGTAADSEDVEDAGVKMSGKEPPENTERQKNDEPAYVYVHICGEVQYPGVYRMPQGSRIYQAVEQAGGMLDSAEETAVNQALAIEDGMKVWIPPKEEVSEADGSVQAYITVGADAVGSSYVAGGTQTPESTGNADGRVNINTATERELCTLTGIGESRAKSIIQYRTEHGNFQRTEDIMKVTGIKDGAFAKIKDEIVVE